MSSFSLSHTFIKSDIALARVAQLAGASCQYAKVVDLLPGQGTYKKLPMNAYISGTTN